MIDGGNKKKFLLLGSPSEITSEQIISFVESVEAGTAKEYKIDEQVVYEDGSSVEDEL